MFKMLVGSTLLALAGLVSPGHAQWIDYDAMLRASIGRQNEIVGHSVARGQAVVSQNMHDPRIQQMYREYRAQGGPMSFEQYCYSFAATAGGTNVGGYIAVENEIADKERSAAKAYHDHTTDLWNRTNVERNEVYDRIAADRGDLVSGSTNFYNPHSGRNERLPYNGQAGSVITDGYGFPRVMNSNGTYQYGAPNGWNYEMQPVWNR